MNIIFDLGGVVFHWDSAELASRCFPLEKERELAYTHFLRHTDWVELDRGTLDPEVALQNASARSGLPVESFRRILDEAPEFLAPKEDTHRLIRRLKEKGHRLFVLSNMHHETADYLEETYSIFEVFEEKVFSCRVEMVKPEARIFRHILKEYSLNPGQTVFIDDMKENVAAAAMEGIIPLHFTDAGTCEKTMIEKGWL